MRVIRSATTRRSPLGPNLVVIDGGKGQLTAALQAIRSVADLPRMAVIALAKREEEVFVPGRAAPVRLERHDPGLAAPAADPRRGAPKGDRTARQRRDMRAFESIFDGLEGIGAGRRRAILQHFGSAERFLQATQEELEGVPGLPERRRGRCTRSCTRRGRAWVERRCGCVAFSEVHGNPSATRRRSSRTSSRRGGIDVFWVLGDHAALGPEPVEALGTLAALPHATFTRGNTDRYVLTGDLPPPSIGDPVQSAAFFAWTRGVLTAGGWLEWLDAHPLEVRLTLPDGTRVLGVRREPGRDDGLGLRAEQSEDELGGARRRLRGRPRARRGRHAHATSTARIAGVRLVNLGSVSLPMREARARPTRSWTRGRTATRSSSDASSTTTGGSSTGWGGCARPVAGTSCRGIYAARAVPRRRFSVGSHAGRRVRYRTVPSVRKSAVKPAITLTAVSVMRMPTLNASSTDAARPHAARR